jgi:integrase
VIVLLSAKAGLRAGEIANLSWDMVLEPSGAISTVVELRDHAAKKRSGRLIPLHAEVRDALSGWRSIARGTGPVVLSERGRAMTPLSVVIWFARAYRAIGLEGCSSHSGRRTFITRVARLVRPPRAGEGRWCLAKLVGGDPKKSGDSLTIRWRDFPQVPNVVRPRFSLALLCPHNK